ncbi:MULTISPECIES: hypothetical protein [unclassified Streptomyces]|uniref:hypothetical protein n=1 Tax=unclassified Streptomyces TaxID=2593676 RepID=UPI0033C3DA67
MQHPNTPESDDWNERAIPTVPGQRAARPLDDWDTAAALARFPRRQRPDTEQD